MKKNTLYVPIFNVMKEIHHLKHYMYRDYGPNVCLLTCPVVVNIDPYNPAGCHPHPTGCQAPPNHLASKWPDEVDVEILIKKVLFII